MRSALGGGADDSVKIDESLAEKSLDILTDFIEKCRAKYSEEPLELLLNTLSDVEGIEASILVRHDRVEDVFTLYFIAGQAGSSHERLTCKYNAEAFNEVDSRLKSFCEGEAAGVIEKDTLIDLLAVLSEYGAVGEDWDRAARKVLPLGSRGEPIAFSADTVGKEEDFVVFCVPTEHDRGEARKLSRLIDAMGEVARNSMLMNSLHRELDRYVAVMETKDNPFFLLVGGKLEFFTKGLPQLLGVDRSELEGASIEDFLHREDAEIFRRAVKSLEFARASENPRRYYRVYRTANSGNELEICLQPVSFMGKKALRGSVQNSTRLDDFEKMAFEGKHLESLATLAGGIAHDFNNILGAMIGYASLIRTSLSSTDENVRYLRRIEEAGMRAVKIARQLLSISRKGRYRNDIVDLRDILNRVSKSCIVPMDHISVQEKIDARETTVKGDPSQLYEAFLNICMNAREAMPGGGRIKIGLENVELDYRSPLITPEMKEGRYVKVTLSDSGRGISPEVLRRVADPFFTTKQREGRKGLGLPVALGIIESHKGKLKVESKLGEGTAITILLPTAEREEPTEKEVSRRPVESITLLVVDDEEIVCSLASDMSKKLGFEVLTTMSGMEAIEILNRKEVDVVVLDLVMPEMNGQEVFQRIKEQHPYIPIIISSGYTEESVVQNLLSEGAAFFLKKPYKLEDLKEAVEEASKRLSRSEGE